MAAYSPREMARMLGIAPITLRKWSAEFAALLTPSGAGSLPIGEASGRLYSDGDLRVLQYAATLLKQNRNYAHAREQLIEEFGARTAERARYVGETEIPEPEFAPFGTAPDDTPGVVEAEVIEPEPRVPPDIAAMLGRMSDLYQELLRNKEQEIAALRQALDMTELAAANERRELEMLNKLAQMMERENQRLTAELEEARGQIDQSPAIRRGWLARVLGRASDETQSAPQT
jgi:DNA-binding transcriptional MerR regulator